MKIAGTDQADMEDTISRKFLTSQLRPFPPLPRIVRKAPLEQKTDAELNEAYTKFLESQGRLATPEESEEWEREYKDFKLM